MVLHCIDIPWLARATILQLLVKYEFSKLVSGVGSNVSVKFSYVSVVVARFFKSAHLYIAK